MDPNPDAREVNQALMDLQHQLDLLLCDIADLHSAARTLSPGLLKICRHLEILISEAETVLRSPGLLRPIGHSGRIH